MLLMLLPEVRRGLEKEFRAAVVFHNLQSLPKTKVEDGGSGNDLIKPVYFRFDLISEICCCLKLDVG